MDSAYWDIFSAETPVIAVEKPRTTIWTMLDLLTLPKSFGILLNLTADNHYYLS